MILKIEKIGAHPKLTECVELLSQAKDALSDFVDENTKEEDALKPRELTFGEKAAGVSFNPSKDPAVDECKRLFADIIDICNDSRSECGRGEKARYFSKAISHSEDAQMNAVKAITWKD